MDKNDLRVTKDVRRTIRREVVALEGVLTTLAPLTFDERRRLLRWACERYAIAAHRLTLP